MGCMTNTNPKRPTIQLLASLAWRYNVECAASRRILGSWREVTYLGITLMR
jgi:hypothetical protein